MQRQRARAHTRCWQHFLSALFSSPLAGYSGAKHDKSMTAGGEVMAALGAEVPVVPDVNKFGEVGQETVKSG